MKFPFPTFGFPLLTKDLLEQAQRKRTYLVRAIEAFLLYVFVLFITFEHFARAKWHFFEMLGTGKVMLEGVFTVTAWGIYLILPAMTCGAIAGERERETWQLLLVTRLGKRTILLEKYFSRVVAALSFLVLTIPIMVVAYPMGGVTSTRIFDAVWCLLLCILIVGATGICCSAWCRTIAGALISTYLLIVGWIMIPLMIVSSLYSYQNYHDSLLHLLYQELFPGPQEAANIPFVMFWMPNSSALTWTSRLHYSIPSLVQVGILLGFAYWGISRPIETGGESLWKRAFRFLDGFFHAINRNSVTRGKKFFENRADLPVDHPIAWRERSRALLSSPLQRIRLAVFLATVLVITFAYAVWTGREEFTIAVPIILFCIACLFFAVSGASAISRERSRQTLDVLLVTPISGREILKEKMAGINRWYWWMMCCYGAIIAVGLSISASVATGGGFSIVEPFLKEMEWLVEAVLLLIYLPPLTIWISVACGMVSRSQSRAVIMSLMIVGGWCLVGWGIAVSEIMRPVLQGKLPFEGLVVFMIFGWLAGPLFVLSAILFNQIQFSMDLPTYLFFSGVNAGFHLILSRVIRWWCYRNISRRLGRLEIESGTGDIEEGAEVA